MHIVAVTRCKDEGDIIESFVRHTLHFVDEMVVLDNGSVDRSLEILRSLRAEGLPLHLFQHIDEVLALDLHSNWLFEIAVGHLKADWVLFLDTDEFIRIRTPNLAFRDWLNATPDNEQGINVLLENYHPLAEQLASGQANVVKRITHRWPSMPLIPKVFYRHCGGVRPTISAGQHYLKAEGGVLPCRNQADVVLSHFNARSPWQLARKAMIGWLRMEASGTDAKNTGIGASYRHMFELLKDSPDVFMVQVIDQRDDLVFDPLPYMGGDLQYTESANEMALFIQATSEFALRIANQHGQRVDSDPTVLQRLRARIADVSPLL
ncbi:glycosyltransferase family 2 protein [Pararhodospirillum photometricum]|uniref:glycosyltransferase family 2 protein n=1 Tax=Pararhodospirillum photometricum TaxID=1084 RepID=UPI0005A1975C|nr:glycosyltransferase family 2 protein [Pararhodospirillum photometricum]